MNTQSELRHYQQWVLEITPAQADPWPRVTDSRGREFQPRRLMLSTRSGDRCRGGHLIGVTIRADGTEGKRPHGTHVLPPWAAELLEREMATHHLTREYLASQGVEVAF
jgi:hypothetical protein